MLAEETSSVAPAAGAGLSVHRERTQLHGTARCRIDIDIAVASRPCVGDRRGGSLLLDWRVGGRVCADFMGIHHCSATANVKKPERVAELMREPEATERAYVGSLANRDFVAARRSGAKQIS